MNWDEWDKIPGWFNALEGKALYDEVKALGSRALRVVEIGSFRGKSTVAILEGCKDAGMMGQVLSCVDNFSGTGETAGETSYERRLEGGKLLAQTIDAFGLRKWLLGINGTSSEEWLKDHPVKTFQNAYNFFFIDGCHPCAAEDALAAWPLLKPGGVMICHDYDPTIPDSEVVKALDECGLPGKHIGVAGTSLWKAIKP